MGLYNQPELSILTIVCFRDYLFPYCVGAAVEDPWLQRAKAAAPSLWIGTALVILHSVMILYFHHIVVYVMFVVVVLMRAFLIRKHDVLYVISVSFISKYITNLSPVEEWPMLNLTFFTVV